MVIGAKRISGQIVSHSLIDEHALGAVAERERKIRAAQKRNLHGAKIGGVDERISAEGSSPDLTGGRPTMASPCDTTSDGKEFTTLADCTPERYVRARGLH